MQQQAIVGKVFTAIGDIAKRAYELENFELFRALVDLVIELENQYPKEMEKLRKCHVKANARGEGLSSRSAIS